MELATFYKTYLTYLHLDKVGESLSQLDKIVEEKIEEAKSDDYLTLLGDSLKMEEIELIKRYSNALTGDNIITLPFNPDDNPFLIYNHHLLYIGDGEGVMHEEVIDGILRNFGSTIHLAPLPEGINVSNVTLNNAEYTTTVNLLDYPIIEYYDLLLTEEHMNLVAENLDLDLEEYKTRPQIINAISKRLVHKEYMEEKLKLFDEDELERFKEKVQAGQVLFTEEEGNWDTFLATGIIMPYLPNVAILPLVLFHFFKEEIFD
ncbi:hypothetical protein LNK15_02685 [Jeotgalicoccus huakuii]|uniref:hypothetical protein n=1 Tax=Jeotgalicoccus TaxID=227979 RepID=UPI000400CEDF|nr:MULTISPECIES: hypothetical protein [Jeotgalicoccus]MCK1975961.1 hypothetical protein [Jeotgalicoccus huakuii]QQD84749.1 hypothetical protein JEM45_09035 [Jeotgalicoccus sp. ATCC 8456]